MIDLKVTVHYRYENEYHEISDISELSIKETLYKNIDFSDIPEYGIIKIKDNECNMGHNLYFPGSTEVVAISYTDSNGHKHILVMSKDTNYKIEVTA